MATRADLVPSRRIAEIQRTVTSDKREKGIRGSLMRSSG